MSRNLILPALLLLLPLTGCLPPGSFPGVEPRMAPVTDSKVLTLPLDRGPEALMSRLLEVLQDMGCQVTSVDARLGHVAFRQTWVDESRFIQPRHVVTGTLLLTSQDGGGSRLRLLAQGWTEVERGGVSNPHLDRSPEKPLSTQEAQRFLETLRTRLLR